VTSERQAGEGFPVDLAIHQSGEEFLRGVAGMSHSRAEADPGARSKSMGPKTAVPLGAIHVTTVHKRGDTRIYVKEICSLADKLTSPIALIVADGMGEAVMQNGVRIFDLGPIARGGRMQRAIQGTRLAHRLIRSLRPRVVHVHDPELIPLAVLLRKQGFRVVYDAHEDSAKQIMGKSWIPRMLRGGVARALNWLERASGSRIDAVVAATPSIARKYRADRCCVVQNFPILSEISSAEEADFLQRDHDFIYVGGMSYIRGVREMVAAFTTLGDERARLHLVGGIEPPLTVRELTDRTSDGRVVCHGFMGRPDVARLLGMARAGLVLLHPMPNYVESQPTKMFEYMAAGIPVIASNFPLWRSIVEETGCGLVVDPLDTEEIAQAMRWVLDNPAEAFVMGARGRHAVERIYQWKPESERLVALYRRLGVE
jgi:glycosyltransferase involved in cell wall biosynthesis